MMNQKRRRDSKARAHSLITAIEIEYRRAVMAAIRGERAGDAIYAQLDELRQIVLQLREREA